MFQQQASIPPPPPPRHEKTTRGRGRSLRRLNSLESSTTTTNSAADDSSEPSRGTGSKLSFMKTLLTNDQHTDTSDSGINSINSKKSTTSTKNKSHGVNKSSFIKSEEDNLDVLVLLGNEKSVDKIESLTNREYDLCHFRNLNGGGGFVQKISILKPRIYYLKTDEVEQVEREKRKKFDYGAREPDSVFVDPWIEDNHGRRRKEGIKKRRSRSQSHTVFRCVSRANPRNNLKNLDRTRSIHEHMKRAASSEDRLAAAAAESSEIHRLSKQELAESAKRLSRRQPQIKHS